VSGSRLAVVGNPDNRRVTLFAEAAEGLGLPPPRVVPWLDVLRDRAVFEPGELVRIDSPGEDAGVARLLHGAAEPVDMYRVEGSRRWYEGFTATLEKLHARIAECGARALADAGETATAFDKARCHALLAAAGISVPEAIIGVTGFEVLESAVAERDWYQVFVKIRHGSSASGVVALTLSGERSYAVTSVELSRRPGGYELYNSLRVRTYRHPRDLRVLIDLLALDGLHVERRIDKIWLGGQEMDLRMVTVDGRVTHAVGRSSDVPMTNLHLGGRRREIAEYRERVGGQRWEAAVELAERTAALFPASHCLGIDIMDDRERSYVAEVNAYGDLLPKLVGLDGTHGEGVDTYTAQLRSLTEIYG
jgi:hypothetical protein